VAQRKCNRVVIEVIKDLFPGGLAEITYSYSYNGKHFSGMHEKQFLSYFEATRYVAGFPKGTQIVVRVRPGQP